MSPGHMPNLHLLVQYWTISDFSVFLVVYIIFILGLCLNFLIDKL